VRLYFQGCAAFLSQAFEIFGDLLQLLGRIPTDTPMFGRFADV
jgi:hypothetical protein